jgi:hypothetical protein
MLELTALKMGLRMPVILRVTKVMLAVLTSIQSVLVAETAQFKGPELPVQTTGLSAARAKSEAGRRSTQLRQVLGTEPVAMKL